MGASNRWFLKGELMPRSQWHDETFEEVLSVIREHFEEAGFVVHVNRPMGTFTIIHRGQALTLMDTTESHFDRDNRLVLGT
jgi:hypothetical protein